MPSFHRLASCLVPALVSSLVMPAVSRAAQATIDPAGYVRVNGEPFFPIGMYHVSWIGDRQGRLAVPDLHTIADAGFNLVHPTIDFRPDMQELFDAAAARDVLIIGEIPWQAAGAAIDRWKTAPAIMGWNVADDFNAPITGPANHPPSEVADRSALVHAHDPDAITFASGGPFPGFTITPYAGTMDLMGFQSYPIDEQSYPFEYELEEAMDEFDYVAEELAGTGQVFVGNPQSFAWRNRFPTPREARNILYAPLIRGAKGIMWYAFWGENGVLSEKNPTLWAELAREVVELKTLRDVLLFGERSDFATGNERVHGAYWEHEGQVFAIVLNTHRTESYSMALPLPADVAQAQALFAARPETGMTVSGGDLVGTIDPEDVHVYLFDVHPAGNVPPEPAVSVTPLVPALGAPVTFDASASVDPDGSVAGVSWDFGDGATGTGAVVQHAFSKLGVHHVRVTVRDDDGTPSTLFAPVSVEVTSLCGATPALGCHPSGKDQLKLKMGDGPKRRNVLWKWNDGPVPAPELGSPVTTSDVALCLWDANGKRLGTGVRAGGAWRASGSGFRYSDRSGAPGGITNGRIATSASDGSVLLKGKGAFLAEVALPLTPPVTAQLISSEGGCWTSAWAGAEIRRNDGESFKASR